MTLDEFIIKHEAVKDLQKNLRANLDAMTDLSEEDKDSLCRLNLIMVRQCLNYFGIV